MELRRLGGTGIEVGPLGLGTVKLGRSSALKYPHAFELPGDAEVRSLLALARELGVNLLDTAPAYGVSEERLGRLLPGPRDRWVICTKVGERFEHGVSSFDFSAAATRASVERSLRRLATDYLDVVLIHSDGRDERILRAEPVLAALRELQGKGWVRAVGMSGKTVVGGLLAAEQTDVVMVTYNPFQREEQSVLKAAGAMGKGVLVKKPLASGHLDRLAADAGIDPVTAAFRFVLAEAAVSSVVVGTIDPGHLRANVVAATGALAAVSSSKGQCA